MRRHILIKEYLNYKIGLIRYEDGPPCSYDSYYDNSDYWKLMEPETLEEVSERLYINKIDRKIFIRGIRWQQEKLCDSEVIQKIRATLSDAEARRIIRTI